MEVRERPEDRALKTPVIQFLSREVMTVEEFDIYAHIKPPG
jgi:hypothetical protein